MSQNTSRFPGPVELYRDRRLPEQATPVGYAALIDAFDLTAPLPRTLFAIGSRHQVRRRDDWQLMTPRHAPDPSLDGHLTFALKYEGVNLVVLKRLFETVEPEEIADIVRATPTGRYSRRIWFFYEWLMERRLDLPDATSGSYVNAIDPEMQYAIDGTNSRRHRVRDNLPGTRQFCPLVFRTDRLEEFRRKSLDQRARRIADDISADLLTRAASFLLLKDSRCSFAIEGERPPMDRMQRWGRAIGQAGDHQLDKSELLRLQRIVIGDTRFVRLGWRREGGFVGEHERRTRMPIPDHISARHEDLDELLDGLVDFARAPADVLDPVVAAAVLAFGFVYIHPFQDGNGRIHRYLIHHVLSRRRFHPPGLVFPISAAILAQIDEYRRVLESYSKRLLPIVKWEPTKDGNVRVLNDTVDYYRYFDATPHAEFLYACVEQTVDEYLPEETQFLRRHDEFTRRIETFLEMPDNTLDLLFRFLHQNGGRLSKRARESEFATLEPSEVDRIETIYADTFAS